MLGSSQQAGTAGGCRPSSIRQAAEHLPQGAYREAGLGAAADLVNIVGGAVWPPGVSQQVSQDRGWVQRGG